MRTFWLLGVALLAASGVAWLALGGSPKDTPGEEGTPAPPLREPPARPIDAPPAAPPGPLEVPGPPPLVAEPEDPEWITAPLPLPPGTRPLTGVELVASVEAAGKVTIRGATPEDLAALRATLFDDIPRDVDHPHAALGGWLKEAGFEMEVVYPSLVVRRRAPETEADGR